jgi:hypothetical protein
MLCVLDVAKTELDARIGAERGMGRADVGFFGAAETLAAETLAAVTLAAVLALSTVSTVSTVSAVSAVSAVGFRIEY